MDIDLYTRVVDALSYSIHSAAMRRDPSRVPDMISTRDEFAALYPEHRDAYVPARDRK
jgi:hypothetical protein